MSQARLPLALLILTAAAGADPVVAQPPGWGGGSGGGWGGGFDRGYGPARRGGADEREGKVQVSRFTAEDIDLATLGHGPIGVAAMPGSPGPGSPGPDGVGPDGSRLDGGLDGSGPRSSGDARQGATFEAAVVDQLAKAGYDTMSAGGAQGQLAEVRVIRGVVRPEEAKRSPVSGETTVGVSNRGSYMGMAINVDMTKPAKALLSTRLMARIRDRASGKVLWEGRADIVTRDGDSRWTEQAIASRLAAALFDDFPARS